MVSARNASRNSWSSGVTWAASAGPDGNFKQGGHLTLTLRGKVLEGWHVYALKQLPDGPTPLRVTLDANDVATADGALAGLEGC